MYQQGPPPRSDGEMPPGGYSGSQYPQYSATYQNPGMQPPPVAHQSTVGDNANTYPGRADRYTPPSPPSMSRPTSQYNPNTMPPRPGHVSSSHYGPQSVAGRSRGSPKSHYGHLVSEGQGGTSPCSGDAWGACCKYNALAFLLSCNGCLRLCGCGMSIMEVLHLN
ncbi:hypothetical protein COEREDRAFT_81834 [Coemansia reversa NRRL 1564]|uniref:Uncharacterized protein n=1 Tax=Coemansia reversa (strain ATCC 12441 / NRRL 1564) TaxID=763665 RepID=A0A2G5B9L9_COERN|nr:hypothetical protein COEREDRAFT_81834 [Coemansia reversa NRRL 1564]|eukprot:PIA15704.1 hypothetical protein COEREDRAFT_81834 [Coemansia reversa NRRL 1564]